MNKDEPLRSDKSLTAVLILVFVDFLMNIGGDLLREGRAPPCLNPCFRGLSHELGV